MLAQLANENIVTLIDFADLASFELIDKEEGIFKNLDIFFASSNSSKSFSLKDILWANILWLSISLSCNEIELESIPPDKKVPLLTSLNDLCFVEFLKRKLNFSLDSWNVSLVLFLKYFSKNQYFFTFIFSLKFLEFTRI